MTAGREGSQIGCALTAMTILSEALIRLATTLNIIRTRPCRLHVIKANLLNCYSSMEGILTFILNFKIVIRVLRVLYLLTMSQLLGFRLKRFHSTVPAGKAHLAVQRCGETLG